MPPTLQLPDLRNTLEGLRKRIEVLERRIRPQAAAAIPDTDIIFSYAGTLISDIESPPVKLRYGGILSVLAVGLGTAGSTGTTLEVKKNGTVVATVVVPSSSADYGPDVGSRFAAEDRLTIRVATAGTGAANMTATARFT